MQGTFHTYLASGFGSLLIIWRRDSEQNIKISRIKIPEDGKSNYESLIEELESVELSCPEVEEFKEKLTRALQGQKVDVDLEIFDWELCTDFQKRVMLEEYRIPHGETLSYGELAERIGGKRYSRAVGNVQAKNLFPIIIPCHRVIRSDGSPGNYGGGIAMKRRLLELEKKHGEL